jgi:hypothetical protein
MSEATLQPTDVDTHTLLTKNYNIPKQQFQPKKSKQHSSPKKKLKQHPLPKPQFPLRSLSLKSQLFTPQLLTPMLPKLLKRLP